MGDESFYEPMPSDVRPKPAATMPNPPRPAIIQESWAPGSAPNPIRTASDVLFQSMSKPGALASSTDNAPLQRTPSRPVMARPFEGGSSSPTMLRHENGSPSRDSKAIAAIRKEPSGLARVPSRNSGEARVGAVAAENNYTPMLSNMSPARAPGPPPPGARPTAHSVAEPQPPRYPTPESDRSKDGYPRSQLRSALLDIPPFPQEPAPLDPEVLAKQLKAKIDTLPPDVLQSLLAAAEAPSKLSIAHAYPPTPPPHPSLVVPLSRSALLSLPGSGDNSPRTTPPTTPSPSMAFPSSPLVKDWNREYQHLLSQPDSVSKFERLRDLAADFAYAAETYGRIIISESDLPDSEKTIPPVSMGGRAGGTKYIAQGILFKFALDTEGFYASDEGAIRAAGHELKGVQAYYNTRIPMLKTPLMVLIDYRGFRLTCISLVPIDSSTIKYGSADGGVTVHTDIEELNELMREAARKINLKGHVVGDKTLYAPGDIEAHLGRDGRFYVVDCARVFPPENPPAALEEMEKGALLFKLLRPEFVQGLMTPLSSDSFSGFQRNDPNIYVHNREAKDATEMLLTECIPSFTYKLDKSFEEAKGIKDFGSFASRFHRAGINMRFLNYVRHYSTRPVLRKLLLSEAVARVLKNTLREKLREAQRRLRLPLEHPYKELVISFLNLVIGGTNSGDTDYFWNGPLKQRLMQKFPLVPPNAEDEPVEPVANLDLRGSVELVHVVRLLVGMAGIVMSDRALTDLASARQASDFILIHPDVVGLATKPKQMSIIYEAMERWLYEKATSESKESSRCLWAMVKQPQHNLKGDAHLFEASGKLLFQYATKAAQSRDSTLTHDEVVTLLQCADDKFESASAIDSNSVSMFISWGHMLAFWAQNYAEDATSEALWKRSGEKFQKAIIIGRQRVEDLLSDSLSPTGKSFAILFRAAQYSPQLMAIFQQRFAALPYVSLDGCVTLTDPMLSSLTADAGERTTSLSLRGCIMVTDTAVAPLLAKCSRLTALDLSFTRVTERVLNELPRLALTLNVLAVGGCTELTAKGILAVVKKLPHLTSLVVPNEHSSSLKQIQVALPQAKVKPEAPSRYDLISSPSSDGVRIGVERKGMLQVLKFKSQKWVSVYMILDKDRISIYADAKTQMASEEILLDGSSLCQIAPSTEVRTADSAPKGKPTAHVERAFCFKVHAASAKGKTKVPARTRYFSGQSSEERDAWIIAISNNIALCAPTKR